MGIELLARGGVEPDPVDAPNVDAANLGGRTAVVATAALLVAAVVAAALIWSGGDELAEPGGDAPTQEILPTNTPEVEGEAGPERIEIDPPPLGFDLDALPSAPSELLSGVTLAWIGDDGLQLRDVDTGVDVDLAGSPRIQIPPLPDNSALVRADNTTSAVVPENLGASGLISNTFETVRLRDGVSAFGFVQEHVDGGATISTGTLWGPSIHRVLEVDAGSTVLVAPGQGIAIAHPNGRGELVTGGEPREMPRRWGRVVAVSEVSLAGIHCDAVGVCTGRLTTWDGLELGVIDAAILASEIVRISPSGNEVFAWNQGQSVLAGSGDERRWNGGPELNQTLTWDGESNLLLWAVDGQLLALDPSETSPEPYVVRSVGEVEVTAGGELVVLRL